MATGKKVKMVNPPIVDGETFISLQISKNLDSDLTMEERLRLLYKLQKVDSQVDEIYLLRGELPLEVQDLEDDIEGLKSRIEKLEGEISRGEVTISDRKNEIIEDKAQIDKFNDDKNNVKNNREYDAITKEIEYKMLSIQAAEKNISDVTKLLAEKKIALAEAHELLSGRETDLVEKKKELDNIVADTKQQEDDLLKQSADIQSRIDERTLNAYKKVRSSFKNKLAVVTVKKGACGGCFNKIPPQREIDIESNKKIVVCEYCGRIIVSSEFEKEEE
ncbi:MAG: C4-type zinc ribbon domain-containing protein [Bacteroidales bacterium]|jgi:predicted  nucleic acid-binding Zn-ribbon protein|nr:C4-type zinc ribbon domain-containing protein [Bacteroidales bacterium]